MLRALDSAIGGSFRGLGVPHEPTQGHFVLSIDHENHTAPRPVRATASTDPAVVPSEAPAPTLGGQACGCRPDAGSGAGATAFAGGRGHGTRAHRSAQARRGPVPGSEGRAGGDRLVRNRVRGRRRGRAVRERRRLDRARGAPDRRRRHLPRRRGARPRRRRTHRAGGRCEPDAPGARRRHHPRRGRARGGTARPPGGLRGLRQPQRLVRRPVRPPVGDQQPHR